MSSPIVSWRAPETLKERADLMAELVGYIDSVTKALPVERQDLTLIERMTAAAQVDDDTVKQHGFTYAWMLALRPPLTGVLSFVDDNESKPVHVDFGMGVGVRPSRGVPIRRWRRGEVVMELHTVFGSADTKSTDKKGIYDPANIAVVDVDGVRCMELRVVSGKTNGLGVPSGANPQPRLFGPSKDGYTGVPQLRRGKANGYRA